MDDRSRKTAVSYDGKDAYGRCADSVMRIHRSVILVFGNEHEKGLEDAVISPMAIEGFCDRIEMCEDCFSKAALAIDYIADFHPFFEGNKRTAFELAVALLKKSGYRLNDDEKTFKFIKDVASGMYDREEIEGWLRRNAYLGSL